MNVSDTFPKQKSTTIRGWVAQPNGRGTFDLLVSCAVTVFLCGWSSICVNVPASEQSKWDIFWDKWHLFCLSMLGPEFVFMLALGQYMRADASVKLYHDKGYRDWTIKHGFYADMGGFVLQPHGWKQFPIDAKQLLYLIERGHIRYPDTKVAQINDRNKSDGLARFVTTCQIVWFTLNVITRPTQNLAVTTIEITTIASIVCTLAVNFCWRHKPMDVSTAIVLETDRSMYDILKDAGNLCKEPYRITPLDFVSREEWIATKLWSYNVNILRNLHVVRQRPNVRPIQHLSSFGFPKLSRGGSVVCLLMAVAYSAILMIAWNFEFPTPAERLIWRICTSLTMALTIVVGLVEIALPSPRAPKDEESPNATQIARRPSPKLLERIVNKHFNNSRDKDPALDVPLKSMLLTQPVCAVYTVCRIYVLLEDLIGLRAMPATVFQNVDWTAYWPHI
ncbi:hypothetical protein A1O7_08894 [Cladophialophora yegresii CBS 114405]|uniref:Uncharacterized protein n=1 Tax=Cladophialophora yegresii CBS 114405 TaxID=1182544 RepID=W9VKD8_9EURO|nr:uncharacterized protein A1O7_08894 [Cladophialophora yegresii CBS 114405]EXJ55963.1 hypothetical protein A1O7_08894 [Cladophialophora yegresii CBS 114405]